MIILHSKNYKIFQNFGFPKMGGEIPTHIKKNTHHIWGGKKWFWDLQNAFIQEKQKNLICTRCPGCQKKCCLATGLSGLTFYAIKHKKCVRVIIRILVFRFFTVLFEAFTCGPYQWASGLMWYVWALWWCSIKSWNVLNFFNRMNGLFCATMTCYQQCEIERFGGTSYWFREISWRVTFPSEQAWARESGSCDLWTDILNPMRCILDCSISHYSFIPVWKIKLVSVYSWFDIWRTSVVSSAPYTFVSIYDQLVCLEIRTY